MIIDPIGDFLTRIRNACMVRKSTVDVPWSTIKVELTKVLIQEGFVKEVKEVKAKEGAGRLLRLTLRYSQKDPFFTGLKRVSRPGLRRYVKVSQIPRVYGGHGVAILSTPKGVLTGTQAQAQGVGGELLCTVW